MPYKVIITTANSHNEADGDYTSGQEQHTLIVDKCEFADDVRFFGLDPSLYPDELRDVFDFYSKGLMAVLINPTAIAEIEVKQTSRTPPEPKYTHNGT